MDNEEPIPASKTFDVEIPDIPMPEETAPATVEDTFSAAFRLCFIGAGQGGGRIVEAFHKLGYRRVAAVNSARQDLATLELPDTNKLCLGGDGAGKNPAAALQLFKENEEDVLDFMRQSFGPDFDRIIVCAGAGGGTGAGTVLPLVDKATQLMIALKKEPKVGVILAVPKISEGKKVNENAYFTLRNVAVATEQKQISPLIVLDNEKINTIYPGLAVGPFWNTANSSVASLLHLFNSICVQNSSFTSFDKNDLASVLDSGIIVFGATKVGNWQEASGISRAIRDNLKRNVLSGGIDLSTGNTAGAVVIGGKTILDQIPQDHLDTAFDQLNRLLRQGSTVHRGIYSGNRDTLAVYTVIGGLAAPKEKLEELKKLGDVLESTRNGQDVRGEA